MYTDERNTQIVISLLKYNNIKYVITSPGTTHMCFVGSVQHDPFFKVYSCVDERSAAYMACGLAAEIGEPVVITCTGATASRNYYSALTEAYYRKLPIIAITAHQGIDRIGHLLEQNIDRRQLPFDIVKLSVDAIYVKDERDEHYCEIEVNKAILECKRRGGGPVHINLYTRYSKNFSVKELPACRVIKRYTVDDDLPPIQANKIAIFIGSHKRFSNEEIKLIEQFCSVYDAVVFCDHTSGYNGRYGIKISLALAQQFMDYQLGHVDLLIHLGEVSGDATARKIYSKHVWRVNEDGEIRDTWGKLEFVFEMSEMNFFSRYVKDVEISKHAYFDECQTIMNDLREKEVNLPISTIWVAQQIASMIPKQSSLHMGIWSSLRSMNYFDLPTDVYGNCNVGGFGIDGNLSSLVGASLSNPNKLYFGLVGDLAFFYDMNVLGNRHIGNNLRIIVVNNGRGNEMRYSFSPASVLGDEGNVFLAASNHYKGLSNLVIKKYVESLGFLYFSASSKEEFLSISKRIITESVEKSVVFEVFINDYEDEDRAYQKITTLKTDKKMLAKKKLKSAIKDVVGENRINNVKMIIKK